MIIKAVMFDLDGTLIDSAADIQICLQEAYAKIIHTVMDIDIRPYLGPKIFDIIKTLSPGLDKDTCIKIEQAFRSNYDDCGFENSKPYDGAGDLLRYLYKKGKRLFIVTNKPLKASQLIINKYFDYGLEIFCPDSYPHLGSLSKEKIIALIIKRNNFNADEVSYVGDTAQDVNAAHSQGIQAVAVTYGYGNKDDLYASKPEFTVEELGQLIEFLN